MNTQNDKTIISASRRTDIPSFFSDWFMERIEEGYVEVKNPYNPNQMRKVSLLPEDVSAIVFWTRDFSPMMKNIDKLDSLGYKYVILWTLTGYPEELERISLTLENSNSAIIETSEAIGKNRIAWRYDPIIFNNTLTPDWHLNNFAHIADKIGEKVDRVIISLMTPYRSVITRMHKKGISYRENPLQDTEVEFFLQKLSGTAKKSGIARIQACCQSGLLQKYGIPDGACIDSDWLTDALDIRIPHIKDKGQRKNCLCTKSVDIGAYKTCKRACVYCYA